MAEGRLGVDGIEAGDTIGSGGNSVVHQAWEPDHDRWVAVKILRGVGDEDALRRFRRERKAMGRLSQHSGIATIFRSGINDYGEPYLVMPFFEEGSLQDRLSQTGPLPWPEACDIIATVARTVHYAHEHGVIHRDLKPANILISESGTPSVADFGIAKFTTGQTSSLATTAFTFTPGYSPPEVLEQAEPSPQADVYSLAATLFALIRGVPPFSAEPNESLVSLLRRIADDPPPVLEPSEAPDAVAALIGRALDKQPNERPTTAANFADELELAVTTATAAPNQTEIGAAAHARDPDTPHPPFRTAPTVVKTNDGTEPESKPWRRNLGFALGAAVVVVVAVFGIAVLLSQDDDPSDPPTPSETTLIATPTPETTEPPTPTDRSETTLPASTAVAVTSPAGCEPISPLSCGIVQVALPFRPTWVDDPSGLPDGRGRMTGFTMTAPAEFGRADDSFASSQLDVDAVRGVLTITTANGTAFGEENSLENGLGVAVRTDGLTETKVTIVDLPALEGGNEHAGVWLFLGQDHYVKMTIISDGAARTRIQMMYERDDAVVAERLSDEVIAAGSSVTLWLRVNPAERTATGLYVVGADGPITEFLTVDLSRDFVAGVDLEGSPVVFSGLMATHRRADAPVRFEFSDFSIERLSS